MKVHWETKLKRSKIRRFVAASCCGTGWEVDELRGRRLYRKFTSLILDRLILAGLPLCLTISPGRCFLTVWQWLPQIKYITISGFTFRTKNKSFSLVLCDPQPTIINFYHFLRSAGGGLGVGGWRTIRSTT